MIRKELFKNADDRRNYVEHVKQTNLQPGRNNVGAIVTKNQ